MVKAYISNTESVMYVAFDDIRRIAMVDTDTMNDDNRLRFVSAIITTYDCSTFTVGIAGLDKIASHFDIDLYEVT